MVGAPNLYLLLIITKKQNQDIDFNLISLEPRNVIDELWSDHYLENIDPAQIEKSNAYKLKPVP